jgi:tRNA-Thr(GGU) m(6)t(6)A37 methyltransferase TsaA
MRPNPRLQEVHVTTSPDEYVLHVIGCVRSALRDPREAPRQGSEGAPDAWLELDAKFAAGLRGLSVGDEVVVLTWLHAANRAVLEVHPRNERTNPLTGVFVTRSPHRPNPIGLHRVTVIGIEGTRLHVVPLEAIDGTPVIDIKAVLDGED